MMQTDNTQLLQCLREMKIKYEFFCNKRIKQRIQQLEEQLQSEAFNVVVLGEFKRGKSTFVNALLRTELLPMDVLPETATINALLWSDEPRTEVIYSDGRKEVGGADAAFLRRFTAKKEQGFEDIRYLKIGLQADVLKNNIVLVDTPGVSDLNEQRVQLTYEFIPQADAIIFLLDAAAPLKKSEKEFIEDYLGNMPLDRILFIANKFDEIEEEEEENVIGDMQKRIAYAFKGGSKSLSVLPLSAETALAAIKQGDKEQLKASGLLAVEKKLQENIAYGTSAAAKQERFKQNYSTILRMLEREVENRVNLSQGTKEEIEQIIENLHQTIENRSGKIKVLYEYIENEQVNIFAMTKKSIVYFYNELQNEIHTEIDLYRSSDFQEFVEKRIPDKIHKGMKRWVSLHFPAIEMLFDKLNQQIVESLARYFQVAVNLSSAAMPFNVSMVDKHCRIKLAVQDVSDTGIKVGLITATVAVAAIATGMSVLTPALSMGVAPLLHRRLLNSKLDTVKRELQPQIDKAIGEGFCSLTEELEQIIQRKINEIKENTQIVYQNLIDQVRRQIDTELYSREQEKVQTMRQLDEYNLRLQELYDEEARLNKI